VKTRAKLYFYTIVLILLVMFPASSLSTRAGASNSNKIIVVPYMYKSLQDAIAKAKPGSIILIEPGYYNIENLYISKPLIIVGISSKQVILRVSDTIYISKAANVLLANVTINNGIITIQNAYNVTLYNIEFQKSVIKTYESDKIKFMNISFINDTTEYAIYTENSADIYIGYIKTYNSYGIKIRNTYNMTICCSKLFASFITDHCSQINIEGGRDIKIANNAILGGFNAICSYNSANILVANNILFSCTSGGGNVLALSGTSAEVTHNFAYGCSHFIWLSSSSVRVTDNIVVTDGTTIYVSSNNNRIEGGHNDFYMDYGSPFCYMECCSNIYGSVLDSSYRFPGFYESYTEKIVDKYSGPRQDIPGGDYISDQPLRLCDEISSSYASLVPVLYPAVQKEIIRPWNIQLTSKNFNLIWPIMNREVGNVKVSYANNYLVITRGVNYDWFSLPIPAKGIIRTSFIVKPEITPVMFSIILWNGTPVYPIYTPVNYSYPTSFMINISMVSDEHTPKIAIYLEKPGRHKYFTVYEKKLSSKLIVNTYQVTIKYNGANNSLKIEISNPITNTTYQDSVNIPVALEGTLWLGMEEVAPGNSVIELMPIELTIAGAREPAPPKILLGLDIIKLTEHRITITMPYVYIKKITVPLKTVTITIPKTITTTKTKTIIATRTKPVTVTITRPTVYTKVVTKPATTTTTITKIVTKLSDKVANYIMILFIVSLIFAYVLSKL